MHPLFPLEVLLVLLHLPGSWQITHSYFKTLFFFFFLLLLLLLLLLKFFSRLHTCDLDSIIFLFLFCVLLVCTFRWDLIWSDILTLFFCSLGSPWELYNRFGNHILLSFAIINIYSLSFALIRFFLADHQRPDLLSSFEIWKGPGKGGMEYGAGSGETARDLVVSSRKKLIKKKTGTLWGMNVSRIHAWRATVSSFNSRGSASPESVTGRRLPPFDLDESSLAIHTTVTRPIEPDHVFSIPSSPPSVSSTIQDSEATEPLSIGPSQSVRQPHSTEIFSPTALLSVDIHECILSTPKSTYEGFKPPDSMPVLSEWMALQTLSPYLNSSQTDQHTQDFKETILSDFAIYLDTPDYPEEMRSLHHLNTKIRHGNFFFDGVLSISNKKVYVRRVQIAAVPIGNYGSVSKHTVRDDIWLQSSLGSKQALFYKLGKPAREYRRFF
jgi:hypothetical protein